MVISIIWLKGNLHEKKARKSMQPEKANTLQKQTRAGPHSAVKPTSQGTTSADLAKPSPNPRIISHRKHHPLEPLAGAAAAADGGAGALKDVIENIDKALEAVVAAAEDPEG